MPNGFYERLGNQNSRTLILRRSLGMFYKPFYRYGSHIEFIWFKEYYGMPRGALFGQKENFTVCFSGKRRSLLHLNTAQRSFFPLQSFSRKTSRKIGSKRARITAISRKVVGKSARDNAERYCRWFWVHCSSKKSARMAREAMDLCL